MRYKLAVLKTVLLIGLVTGVFSTMHSLAQDLTDSTKATRLNGIVISASRLEEDLIRSPVSIEKADQSTIRRSASPSFFDAIENIKGVQMITPSLGFKVINTRGFANTTNVRFAQLVDGMDNQAPHLGAPIANALGPSDLDIESVEIIPGVASALYGMNAINGMANIITKDPFKSQGLSIQQKTGFNRVGTPDGMKVFSETNLRWSQAIGSRFAFKVNGTFIRGTDWIADDHTDLNPKANSSTNLTGADNPAFDPVNGYGNESSNRKTLFLNGKNYVVARTGYYEREVVDYTLQNIKGDASLNYALNRDAQIVYTYRVANLDNVYQRANRFRLDNYQLQQHGIAYLGKSIQFRTYLNIENTGESYNARSMAENIDKQFKGDDKWFGEYSTNYKKAITEGATVADAHRMARQLSDSGRPQPGTAEFKNLITQLGDINDWNYGAALRVKSWMLHSEGQYNLTSSFLKSLKENIKTELLVGFDYRSYIIMPDGNYFINPTDEGHNLVYTKYGGSIQATKGMFSDKLKLGATLRADKNEYYPLKWNPRFTMVYAPANKHVFRASYQNGYRFPSVFEAFSNVNSGGVKRVGGLRVMSDGVFENAYKRASIDAFQAAVIQGINQKGETRNEAIVNNQDLLAKNDYTYVEPEHIRSIEVGYRGLLSSDNLQVDIDFYFNKYTNFIGQVEMNVPKTANPDSIPFYLNDKSKQDRYRMWTNSNTVVYNYGSSLGLKYNMVKNFYAAGNLTYSTLARKSASDGFEDGFNTPKWITNVSVGNDNLFSSVGFMITYRWQSSYFWQSFLVSGNVPAYQTVDAQVSGSWNKFTLKVGATNLFNHYYNSFLGGPAVGGLYYTAVILRIG